MIDWPKKMRLNHQGTAAYLLPASDGTPSGTEVLVYPADQIERDWSMLEASQASLREHMQEIHTLRELVREAHVFGSSWSIAEEWHERAVKALEKK